MRRAVWLLLMAVTLLSVATATVYLAHRRDEALEAARVQARGTARLLEENLRLVLQATTFILDQTAEAAQDHDDGPAWQRLAVLEAGLPETGRLYVTDAEGAVVLSASGRAAQSVHLGDSPYFRANRDGRDIVVGPVIPSPETGEPVFTVSRRIVDKKDDFLGIAVANIETGYLDRLLKDLNLAPSWDVQVHDGSGAVILGLGTAARRAAQPGPMPGHTGVSIRLGRDGVERLTAYRALPDLGIVIAASIATDDALADWRRAAALMAATMVPLGVMLAGLAIIVFQSLDREQATMRGLEEAVREQTTEARLRAEEAWRANETKTRFLAAASHDLRQPLQAAGMFVETLSNRLCDTPHQPIVDKLRQCVDATGTLLNTLMDVSTLEAGKVRANVSTFALAPLLASLADQMEPLAADRHLRFRMVSTRAAIVSDPVLLERILRNFLVNAMRYTKKGGVLIGCRPYGDGHLAIQVADTGCGIPEDKLGVIFEDFVRLDGDSRLGPGLGLGVARRMAQLLGHRIDARSALGKGSVFAVIVPLSATRAALVEESRQEASTVRA
ncbi:MAG: ATP-binding protein [Magnetospirillum sp.]|nr:ATP-binding protein [Magnetospirillum sp.]